MAVSKVYDQSMTKYVLPYLVRLYNTSIGEELYYNKTINDHDVQNIEKYVLPKPLKPIPEIVYEDTQTKLDGIRYLTRQYGQVEGSTKWSNKNLTQFDKKMIHTMGMLYKKYNQSSLERVNIHETTYIQSELQNVTTKEVIKCKAFKMNGEQCTAKSKKDGLCLRHSNKVLN
jgi:hypothetical protein